MCKKIARPRIFAAFLQVAVIALAVGCDGGAGSMVQVEESVVDLEDFGFDKCVRGLFSETRSIKIDSESSSANDLVLRVEGSGISSKFGLYIRREATSKARIVVAISGRQVSAQELAHARRLLDRVAALVANRCGRQ